MTPTKPPNPFRVGFLVLPHASLLTVASTLDPLRSANRHLGYEAFQWLVISPGAESVALTCGLDLPGGPDLTAVRGFDMLIVIAGFRVAEVTTAPLLRDIRKAAASVPVIGAIDTGTWILAKAGLLKGARVTVHWEDIEALALEYPDLDVLPDRYVTGERVITAGGAGPAFDMMVDLIRNRFGAQLAHEVASSFITSTIDHATPQRRSQYGGIAVHDKVAAAIRLMEATIATPLATAALAKRVQLSVRRLETLFQSSLGYSPGAFYSELRLQAARRILATGSAPMTDIAIRTGFSSASVLSRAFTRRFGESALAFRRKNGKYAGNGLLRPATARAAPPDQPAASQGPNPAGRKRTIASAPRGSTS
ncbi:GlxA family transcriptional regulator [Paragemmobacter straminiformis]|uniref:GlxA family transcriptional regulator n=1 Tax=Paragemmobacter straminiformis TaxID=2045119 RepID=A0A842I7J2_9RHOB|nr:GlxA family transcriptional regulator [Gemmobacter straminiformis]MBC2835044.1 GlxA family transcriptional regulator [Gemmobacter straminiformis]